QNFNPVNQSPEDEQRWDREFLVARSTALERDDALAGGAVAEMVTSVVGTGLGLHPEPAMKLLDWSQDQSVDWSETTKERFQLWAQDPRECDLARRRNFYQGQSLAYRTSLSRGDTFVLLPRRKHPGTTWATKFQIIEGDRCCMPRGTTETDTFSQGVELDPATGCVQRYWFCKKYPRSVGLTSDDWMPVDAWDASGSRQVLHLMHEDRIDLRRGYPLLGPVIQQLKQMSRLSESELAAAVVCSFFAVGVEKNGSGPGPLGPKGVDYKGNPVKELGPALIAEFQPGEKLVTIAPNRPNGAFDPFWRSLMGQISMRIQVPPEVLLKKFESSYTAARGALLQFWKFVLTERENLLAPNFCQPLYEAWLAEEVAAGRIVAPGFFRDPLLRAAYCSARWIGDNPPILDPLKEVMASEEMIAWASKP
ncbi:MAG TPA: phage portal protein, partial [Holophaga sp.]|nr:phage portal protein [Holophaga sp.]